MPTYRISRQAAHDLQAIYRHSRRSWGRDQAAKYASQLKQCFTMLAHQPRAGRTRPELHPPGLRSFPQGSHIVFYQQEQNGILIVRVLHAHQDIVTLMRPEDSTD